MSDSAWKYRHRCSYLLLCLSVNAVQVCFSALFECVCVRRAKYPSIFRKAPIPWLMRNDLKLQYNTQAHHHEVWLHLLHTTLVVFVMNLHHWTVTWTNDLELCSHKYLGAEVLKTLFLSSVNDLIFLIRWTAIFLDIISFRAHFQPRHLLSVMPSVHVEWEPLPHAWRGVKQAWGGNLKLFVFNGKRQST